MVDLRRGKRIYGIVTVGERGQISIPKEARAEFDIKPGDKLIVAGFRRRGIHIMKAEHMREFALSVLEAFNEESMKNARGKSTPT